MAAQINSDSKGHNFNQQSSVQVEFQSKVWLEFYIFVICHHNNSIIPHHLYSTLYLNKTQYQPSGAGGTGSPPAKSKMAAMGPQNCQQGLERGLR